jgi:hypothetical protein
MYQVYNDFSTRRENQLSGQSREEMCLNHGNVAFFFPLHTGVL